jgi:hypothetical protein
LKTINEQYSKQDRMLIATQLRKLTISNAGDWSVRLSILAKDYVLRVLYQHNATTFSGWLDLRGCDIWNYRGGTEKYIYDALNRLADELEAVK